MSNLASETASLFNAELVVFAILTPLGSEALSLVGLRPPNIAERKRYDFR
jgi:uncharacterized DUF497 family protein